TTGEPCWVAGSFLSSKSAVGSRQLAVKSMNATRITDTAYCPLLTAYWYINKCSTIGPSASDGMNVSAPTISTTPTSIATNSGVWVGRVPGPAGTIFFLASEPAIASVGMASQ